MLVPHIARYWALVAFASVALTSCQSQAVGIPTNAASQYANVGTRATGIGEKASTGAELFVATGNDVFVLSYPGGSVLGHLGIPASSLCADRNGNVYVPTSAYQIAEYSHDGKLVRTLQDGDTPLGCAVDPTTGNLAVTNEGSGAGEVAIYPNGQGPAQWYRDPAINTFGLCGYDDSGNLFVDGMGSTAILAELPKGSGTLRNYPLNASFDAFGSVQWDGKYVALSAPSKHAIYRVQIVDGGVAVAGTTKVRGWYNAYSGHWPYVQTPIEGGRLIAQTTRMAKLGLWAYPAGGLPAKAIGPFERGNANVSATAVSIAPR